MATKVECKTCSKCLWGRTGGGDTPLCLLPLPELPPVTQGETRQRHGPRKDLEKKLLLVIYAMLG